MSTTFLTKKEPPAPWCGGGFEGGDVASRVPAPCPEGFTVPAGTKLRQAVFPGFKASASSLSLYSVHPACRVPRFRDNRPTGTTRAFRPG